MRNIIFVSFISLLLLQSVQAQQLIDKVISQVGGELILLSDLQEQLAVMKERGIEMPPDAECKVLESLIVQKLFVNQAKLDSVEVSDEEVEQILTAKIDHILALMNQDEKRFEEYYGQTVNEVKERFRPDIKDQKLGERMRAKALEDVHITPAEVVAFYNAIPPDSIPYFNMQVEVAELVIKPKVNPQEYQKARQRLLEVKKKIENGADFAEMAKKYSMDYGSGRQGGSLGWMKRGSLVPQFEAAAYNLRKNEISDIVETEFGLHLIQLLDRRGDLILTRHILIKPEITEADIQKTENLLDSIRHLVMNDSMSFSLAVKKYGEKSVQSYYTGGRIINPKDGTTIFDVGDLDADTYFAIDSLEAGDITPPIRFEDPRGGTQLKIIQLLSRTPPHSANLKQDYDKILNMAKQKRQGELLDNWIKTKLSQTYFNVDPQYLYCPEIKRLGQS